MCFLAELVSDFAFLGALVSFIFFFCLSWISVVIRPMDASIFDSIETAPPHVCVCVLCARVF